MFEFFDSISTGLGVLVSFVNNVVDATVTSFSMLASAINLPFELALYFPGLVGSCILCSVAFGVVKFILGR